MPGTTVLCSFYASSEGLRKLRFAAKHKFCVYLTSRLQLRVNVELLQIFCVFITPPPHVRGNEELREKKEISVPQYSVYQWYLFLMVAVLEVFAICGQLEVVHGRIGLFVDRILCHCICSMLLTAPLRHIFASTKFPQKGRYIVVGGNNKDRYAVFFVFFV